MKWKIIVLVGLMLVLVSCIEEGRVKVQNNVHNVMLEDISWGDISVYYSLMPGETSDEVLIEDHKEGFPKFGQVEFIMVRGDKQVYLKTKKRYSLDYGETLEIVITDTTEVINPMMQ